MSHKPFWRVLWAVNKQPAADLYTPADALAKRMAQAISDIHGAKMVLVELVPGNAADRPYAPKDWRGMTDWVPVPRKNPTLVHHGKARAATFHLTWDDPDRSALADLYTPFRLAKKIAAAIATAAGAPVALWDNIAQPKSFGGHTRIANPTIRPAIGQIWRGIVDGAKGRIVAVSGNRVQVTHTETGNRDWLDLGEFLATHKITGATRRNPSRSRRAKFQRATSKHDPYGAIGSGSRRALRALGQQKRLGVGTTGSVADYAKRAHYVSSTLQRQRDSGWRSNPRIKDLGDNVAVTVSAREVDNFKAGWPASGLPSRAITFEFQKSTGDLVDVRPDGVLENAQGGGAAEALSHDAWAAYATRGVGFKTQAARTNPAPKGRRTAVSKNRETGEWIVRAYHADGKRYPEADYFTNDKADAEATAADMERRFAKGVGGPCACGLIKSHVDPGDVFIGTDNKRHTSVGCGENAPIDNPRDRAFKSLAVGDVFRFTSERDFPNSGMARGPWRKTGARSYVRDEPGTLLAGITLKVGSINATVLPDGPISNPSQFGKSGKLRWSTFAGGTSAWEGARGYAARTEFGGYHIDPVTTQYGRRAGYSVMFEIGGPGLRPLPDSMRQSGLWRDLGKARSPNEAKAVAQEHHDEILIEIRGNAYNARAGMPQRETISATGRRYASPVSDMATAFSRDDWQSLTLNETGLILQDIADLSDSWTDAEGHGDDLRAARELARRVGAGNLKSYVGSLAAGRQPGERLRKNPAMHFDRKTLPAEAGRILAASFPSYNGNKFTLDFKDSIYIDNTWSGGSREQTVFVRLDTFTAFVPPDSYRAGAQTVPIPEGSVAVQHVIFSGKDLGIRFIAPPGAAKLFPAPAADVTEDEIIVLVATRSYKSSYGGDSNVRFHEARKNTGITEERWLAAKASATAKGYLNKAGAITTAGKNAAEGHNIEYGPLHKRDAWRDNPRRSLHGAGELARAHKTFKMWHEFDSSKMVKMHGPDPMIPKTLVGLGRLHSVVYESDKYAGGPDNPKGERLLYEHEFKSPRPMLATDPDGRNLHIVGGRVKVTRNGLVN